MGKTNFITKISGKASTVLAKKSVAVSRAALKKAATSVASASTTAAKNTALVTKKAKETLLANAKKAYSKQAAASTKALRSQADEAAKITSNATKSGMAAAIKSNPKTALAGIVALGVSADIAGNAIDTFLATDGTECTIKSLEQSDDDMVIITFAPFVLDATYNKEYVPGSSIIITVCDAEPNIAGKTEYVIEAITSPTEMHVRIPGITITKDGTSGDFIYKADIGACAADASVDLVNDVVGDGLDAMCATLVPLTGLTCKQIKVMLKVLVVVVGIVLIISLINAIGGLFKK